MSTATTSTKVEYRSIKNILDTPVVITAAKVLGKTTVGYLVTAHLTDEPEKDFRVRVYSAQPQKVLASIIENELFPMAVRCVKSGGGYALAE